MCVREQATKKRTPKPASPCRPLFPPPILFYFSSQKKTLSTSRRIPAQRPGVGRGPPRQSNPSLEAQPTLLELSHSPHHTTPTPLLPSTAAWRLPSSFQGLSVRPRSPPVVSSPRNSNGPTSKTIPVSRIPAGAFCSHHCSKLHARHLSAEISTKVIVPFGPLPPSPKNLGPSSPATLVLLPLRQC